MKNVIAGAAGYSNSQAPTFHFGTLRRNILAVVSADVFTPAERLRANHSVHECEDAARLALWLKNVRRVFNEREAQAELEEAKSVTAPVAYATAAQTSEIHSLALHRAITRGERSKAMLALPTLNTVQATSLIGELYLKVLQRSGLEQEVHGSTLLAA